MAKEQAKQPETKAAQANLTTRVDPEDGFERTAIVGNASVDVVDASGKLICRLNLSVSPADNWGNVDVILNPHEQQGTFMAWRDGRKIIHEQPEGVSVFAVDISAKAK